MPRMRKKMLGSLKSRVKFKVKAPVMKDVPSKQCTAIYRLRWHDTGITKMNKETMPAFEFPVLNFTLSATTGSCFGAVSG